MTSILFIIVLVICLGAATGTMLLVQERYQLNRIQWLASYLYYLVLTFAFGVFCILGTFIIKDFLQLIHIPVEKINIILIFFPVLGFPFLITAWYLLIKMCNEIYNKQSSTVFAVAYFGLLLLFLILFGIRIKDIAIDSPYLMQKLTETLKFILIGLKILIILIAFIPLILKRNHIINQFSHKFIFQFLSLYFLMQLITTGLFLFVDYYIVITFLFVLFYFIGEFIPAFFVYRFGIIIMPQNQDIRSEIVNWDTFILKFKISKREAEIIQQVCLGKTNLEISEALFITLQTVKDHIHNIFTKTDLKNRVQLINLVRKYM